ncbi:MAG: hypothetical protein AAFP80_15640 [Pseudomonadota bacterium]
MDDENEVEQGVDTTGTARASIPDQIANITENVDHASIDGLYQEVNFYNNDRIHAAVTETAANEDAEAERLSHATVQDVMLNLQAEHIEEGRASIDNQILGTVKELAINASEGHADSPSESLLSTEYVERAIYALEASDQLQDRYRGYAEQNAQARADLVSELVPIPVEEVSPQEFRDPEREEELADTITHRQESLQEADGRLYELQREVLVEVITETHGDQPPVDSTADLDAKIDGLVAIDESRTAIQEDIQDLESMRAEIGRDPVPQQVAEVEQNQNDVPDLALDDRGRDDGRGW